MTSAMRNPLVDALHRLPILEPVQREELPRLQAKFPEPRALAKELLRREWLTAYQVNQIFLGQADDLLIGHFLCLSKIGSGGMGQVFKARQRPFDRIVALKVLRRECLANAKAVQRFQREMRAVGQLRHPHIVHAYDADEAGGQLSIAMEYIDGVDLARLVKRQGPLAIEPALDFIRQAALGLQHAHENGLVHRDIKPANLLVAKETALSRARPAGKSRWGTVKILDLGLARLADPSEASLTILGTVMGTPDFIAPEQALNPHTCDIRADLYSLGCTLYYLITGRIPFPRGGVTEKLLQHQMHDAEPLSAVRRARLSTAAAKSGQCLDDAFGNVPPEVEALVRKLMAKRPLDRFQSPAELADVLENLLAKLGGDPMAVTHTSLATNPNLSLTPLPATLTVPKAEICPPRPPSEPWRSMALGSRPDAIVKIPQPPSDSPSLSRWWLAGIVGTLLVAATILVQANRGTKSHIGDAGPKVEKRKAM